MSVDDSVVESLLLQMTVSDTRQLQQAEAGLKAIMKKASCVLLFVRQIQHSQHVSARQLAAILLRKRIDAFWKRQNQQVKNDFKNLLLTRLLLEPVRCVQLAIAGVVAAVAKHTVPNGEWNQLLEFLLKCFQDQQVKYRELAMLLFRVLSESVGASLQDHFSVLLEIFKKGMVDEESLVVREESLRALGSMFMFCEHEEEFIAFQSLLPLMLEVIACSCRAGNESAVIYGLEVLNDMCEAPGIVDQHIGLLVTFGCSIVVNPHIAFDIREKANSLLVWIAKYQSIKLMNSGLVMKVIEACFALVIQSSSDDDDPTERVNESVSRTQSLGIELLDDLMINLPHELVYEPTVTTAIQLISSSDALHRSSGILVLFVIAEGCAEVMRHDVARLLEYVSIGLKDMDKDVRSNACSALTQFSEHLQPEIFDHHANVLSLLVSVLDNPAENMAVKGKIVSTLEAFCNDMDQSVMITYLGELNKRLGFMLLNVTDRKVLQNVIECIGGVASAAKSSFLPHAGDYLHVLRKFLDLNNEEDFLLRAAAIKCVANLALAIGKDSFFPYASEFVQMVVESLRIDNCDIREACFIFIAFMAEVMPAEFATVVPSVVERIVISLDSNDGLSLSDSQNDENDFGGCGKQFDDVEIEGEGEEELDDDDEGIDNSKRYRYSIMSGYLDEKLAALQAIAALFKHCGPAMETHYEKAVDSLESLSEYMHESVRVMALLAYDDLLKGAFQTWPSRNESELHPMCADIVKVVFPTLTTNVLLDTDKQAASVACDVLSRAIKMFGVGCMLNMADIVLHAACAVICQETTS